MANALQMQLVSYIEKVSVERVLSYLILFLIKSGGFSNTSIDHQLFYVSSLNSTRNIVCVSL